MFGHYDDTPGILQHSTQYPACKDLHTRATDTWPGPKVIKLLTQLSTKFQLLIKTKILTNEEEVSLMLYLSCS